MLKPTCLKGLVTLQLPSSCMCGTLSAAMLPLYKAFYMEMCTCQMSPLHPAGMLQPEALVCSLQFNSGLSKVQE